MGTALRNRLIGFGFKAWVWSVRARRLLGALGRPRLRGVEHFTIPVKDLAVARRFYCDVLGGALFMTIDDAALKKFGRPPAPNGGEGSHQGDRGDRSAVARPAHRRGASRRLHRDGADCGKRRGDARHLPA